MKLAALASGAAVVTLGTACNNAKPTINSPPLDDPRPQVNSTAAPPVPIGATNPAPAGDGDAGAAATTAGQSDDAGYKRPRFVNAPPADSK